MAADPKKNDLKPGLAWIPDPEVMKRDQTEYDALTPEARRLADAVIGMTDSTLPKGD